MKEIGTQCPKGFVYFHYFASFFFWQQSSSETEDGGVYWRVNYERFHQHMRDQIIINAILRKFDKVC